MSYSTVSALMTGICDAIRTKDGTTAQINHQDIPDRVLQLGINWFEILLGNYSKNVVINGTLQAEQTITIPYRLFYNKEILSVECRISNATGTDIFNCVTANEESFAQNPNLEDAVVPSFKILGVRCFNGCNLSGNVDFSGVTSIRERALAGVSAVAFSFPRIDTVGNLAFSGAMSLKSVEFGEYIASIGDQAFWNCYALDTLIIRRTDGVPTLGSRVFNYSLIASGSGYIYVPSSLVAQYQTDTNWSAYAAQIRALEDYTIDGTTTGELDPN